VVDNFHLVADASQKKCWPKVGRIKITAKFLAHIFFTLLLCYLGSTTRRGMMFKLYASTNANHAQNAEGCNK
jgi:hypothetical protein